MADVRRDWRRRKAGSHTREVVRQEIPAELIATLTEMAAALDRLKAAHAALATKVGTIDGFLQLVGQEYQKRKAAA
jgi:hypothetical protein